MTMTRSMTWSKVHGRNAIKDAGGCLHLSKALEITENDVQRLCAYGLSSGVTIFNPDKDRMQAHLSPTDPVVASLEDFLRSRGFMEGRLARSPVVIVSKPGCARQHYHTDYDAGRVSRARIKPLGVLLALQCNTSLSSPIGDVFMESGDVLVFDGDFVHAGAAYDEMNARVHVYLDVPDCKRNTNTTYLV